MLAIPNFSEGRDPDRIAALAQALTSVAGVRLLDLHSDPDHNRSVYTLVDVGGAASSGLVDALLAGAAAAIELLDIATHEGSHPRVGVLDVAPIVYMNDSERGAACAQALRSRRPPRQRARDSRVPLRPADRLAGDARGDPARRPADAADSGSTPAS